MSSAPRFHSGFEYEAPLIISILDLLFFLSFAECNSSHSTPVFSPADALYLSYFFFLSVTSLSHFMLVSIQPRYHKYILTSYVCSCSLEFGLPLLLFLSLFEWSTFSSQACFHSISQGPYSLRMMLSNLFGFHDLLVDFRYMTSKLGENLFPNYMLHLL